MTKIQVTRHYSGFTNIADTIEVGNYEFDGNAQFETYELPEGYTVSNDIVYDPSGIECAIVAISDGIQIISRSGTHEDVVIKATP